jgi:unsaturated chondroitin disaccharide hydrolase
MTSPFRCVLAALVATLALAPSAAAAAPKLTVEGLQRPAGAFSRPLPSGGRAAVSLDLHLSDGAAVGLLGTPGPGEPPLTLRRRGRTLVVDTGDQKTRLPARKLHHVEAATTSDGVALAIDGQAIDTSARRSRDFTLQVGRGKVTIDAFIATPLGDARTLLLHRLAELHAVTPPGKQVLGVGTDGVLRFHRGWTRGLWPGALWQGAAITRSPVFEKWALDATIGNFGGERSDTHDLGFMYGRSSVTAYERLCKPEPPKADERTCARLQRSGLTAADSLAALAATNPTAGMIPTRSSTLCRGCTTPDEADTIIDSMMNLSLLLWAARETPAERGAYRDIVLRHADGAARLLVRPDGSTAQSVHTRRSDGAVLGTHTHQGFSDTSTWSRGQSWAIYGFADTALRTRSPALLDVAERTAAYVAAKDPNGLVPPYDYDAGPAAPTDTSAGVIGAAGLLLLEDACRRLDRCEGRATRWGDLGERMLRTSLAQTSATPPLGLLGGQVFSLGGIQEWDDRGEFIFGLDYGLEAVRRAGDR